MAQLYSESDVSTVPRQFLLFSLHCFAKTWFSSTTVDFVTGAALVKEQQQGSNRVVCGAFEGEGKSESLEEL